MRKRPSRTGLGPGAGPPPARGVGTGAEDRQAPGEAPAHRWPPREGQQPGSAAFGWQWGQTGHRELLDKRKGSSPGGAGCGVFLAEREECSRGAGGGPDRRSVIERSPVNTMLFDLKSVDQAGDVRRKTIVAEGAPD